MKRIYTAQPCAVCCTPFVPKNAENYFCSRACFYVARTAKAKTIESKTGRFLRHVNKTESCWIWTGLISDRGYGRFAIAGKMQLAHRVSYELFKGEILDGLLVCHECDNPPCVNPNHLFIGTHADNMHDMHAKGRGMRGESHTNSKFTQEQILEIHFDSRSLGKIAAAYGISKSHACGIKKGVFWRHLWK